MEKIKKYLRPFLNPKFLISYSIPFALVNGWAWIGSFFLSLGHVNTFTTISAAWLSILWMPFTPEKLVTIPAAIFIHSKLFSRSEKTRQQLQEAYNEAKKDWEKIKSKFKRGKK